jgi:antitoxin ParD1/3/4
MRLIHDRKTGIEALDAAIARGTTDAENGRVKPLQEVFDRLQAKYAALAKDEGR